MLRSPSPSDAAPKSGAFAPLHCVDEIVCVRQVRIGVAAAEVRQRLAVHHGPVRRAESSLEDLVGVRARDGVHRVEQHAEPAAGEQRAQGVEVEQSLHERGVVRDGIDHLHAHVAQRVLAVAVERHVRRVDRMRYSEISRVRVAIADVTCSGAGPPFARLYLTPKSPLGPPGLWLADRMIPPFALRSRITHDAAGVDRMPPRPTSTRPTPFAAAILSTIWIASRLK